MAANNTKLKKRQMSSAKSEKLEKGKWQRYGLYALVLFVVSYGFGSWAVDTGSLWLYLFCFISLYYALDFSRKLVKVTLLANGKNKSNRRSRSA